MLPEHDEYGGALPRECVAKAWTWASGVAGKHQMRSATIGMFSQVEGCSKSNVMRCSEGMPARLLRGFLLVAWTVRPSEVPFPYNTRPV